MSKGSSLDRIEAQNYGLGDTVVFDDKFFVNCRFDGCEIVHGGGNVAYEGCAFANCRLIFVGSAHATVQLMTNFGYKITAPSGENPETKFFQLDLSVVCIEEGMVVSAAADCALTEYQNT